MRTPNRWIIAAAGVLMQVALGAVYAWSVFRAPLVRQFGWSISEVTLTFTISIFVLGISAFLGGLWLNRKGPRVVAITGGILYGLGVFLASFSANKLWWLYLSYGLIGVSGSQRTDYRDRGWWFRGRRSDHGPCGYATHSERWCIEYLCLSGHRIFDRDRCRQSLYAESARSLATAGLGADCFANFATCRTRLHARRSAQDLAVVCTLAPSVSECVRGHFNHLAGSADLSGVDWGKRDRSGEHGGNSEHW